MTTIVNVYEAKARLSQLLALAEAGEEVVIARNGTPIVRLATVDRGVERRPGAWKGCGTIAPDFDDTPADLIEDFYGANARDS